MPPKRARRKRSARFKLPKINLVKPLRTGFRKLFRPFTKHKIRWIVILILAVITSTFLIFKDYRTASVEFEKSIRTALKTIPNTGVIDRSVLPKENWFVKWEEIYLLIEAPPGASVQKVWDKIKKQIPSKFSLYREIVTETGLSNFVKAEYRLGTITFGFVRVVARRKDASSEFLEEERVTVKPRSFFPFLDKFKPKPPKPKPLKPKVKPKPIPIKKPPATVPTKPKKAGPKIVLVIDDVGANGSLFSQLFSLSEPITIAVLPQLPYSRRSAQYASSRGFEVLLHQPVEALHHNSEMGPGGIYVGQNKSTIGAIVGRNLDSLPGVSGSNNHMGSRGTQDMDLMEAYLGELSERGFYYLDSYTIGNSVGEAAAHVEGVPYFKRSVFLDNENSSSAIRAQVYELMRQARARGVAIGIGHYRPTTLQVLKEMIPEIKRQGFQIVQLKDLF
jgi:hypothetical protein